MISYNKLKKTISTDVQNKLQILLNYPKAIIERQEVPSISANSNGTSSNPFLNPSPSNITQTLQPIQQNDVIRIEFDCIYSSGRDYIVNQDSKLGLNLSLTVYIKYDDVANSILKTIKETDYIIFQNKRYKINNFANLYNILQMLKLD